MLGSKKTGTNRLDWSVIGAIIILVSWLIMLALAPHLSSSNTGEDDERLLSMDWRTREFNGEIVRLEYQTSMQAVKIEILSENWVRAADCVEDLRQFLLENYFHQEREKISKMSDGVNETIQLKDRENAMELLNEIEEQIESLQFFP